MFILPFISQGFLILHSLTTVAARISYIPSSFGFEKVANAAWPKQQSLIIAKSLICHVQAEVHDGRGGPWHLTLRRWVLPTTPLLLHQLQPGRFVMSARPCNPVNPPLAGRQPRTPPSCWCVQNSHDTLSLSELLGHQPKVQTVSAHWRRVRIYSRRVSKGRTTCRLLAAYQDLFCLFVVYTCSQYFSDSVVILFSVNFPLHKN